MFETVLGLDPVGAGVVDVLEGLAHPVGARGLEPLPLQAALGLKLEFGQVRLVFEPQVLRPFQQAVLPAPGLPGLVDGLVGVLDHMELVDDLGGVGKPLADAPGESQAHVARHQAHAVRVAVVVHEISCEPFDGMRVLARRHVDRVAFHQIGDHGDVVVSPAVGLVDADRLHARVVLVQARLPP